MSARRLLLVVCLLAVLALAQAKCGWNGKDFSSLMGDDIKGKDSDGDSTYDFYVNVCGTIKSQPQCTSVQAASSTCQVQVNPAGASFNTGNWDENVEWKYIDESNPGKGMFYQLKGAQSCWASGMPDYYKANVKFECAKSKGEMKVVVPHQSCIQDYIIPTPLACAGGGGGSDDGGLSGGWIFIIILAVVVPLYVGVGCVYKSQKLGAVGMERCPNVEFWRDLPSLVKEGCQFTIAKIRGLMGGSAASASSGYETM